MADELIDVDVEFSYARRTGTGGPDAGVRVVLELPGSLALDDADLVVRLVTDDGAAVRAPATATRSPHGWRVEATAPADQVGPGLWKLRLRVADAAPLFLRCRLLISPGRPLALLPGPRTNTRMAPPAPR